MSRRVRRAIFGIGAAGALVLIYDRITSILWVGNTEVDIRVVVTDAGSGRPVAGARVEVQTTEPTDRGEELRQATVTADVDGMAQVGRPDILCSGSRSGLGLTDTFVAHLPWMRVRATAPGFAPGPWTQLNVGERIDAVQRTGPRQSTLVVPLLLRKASDPVGALDKDRVPG